MVEVNCYHCESDQSTPYDSENGFHIVKCSGCGMLYLNPRPGQDEIDAATKSGMHRGDELLEVMTEFKQFLKDIYLKNLNDFNYADLFSQGKKVDWLDIGCGHGEFVQALNELGGENINILGLEPNEKKREGAIKRGLNVDFFDTTLHDGTYDVISALNVYSHLPNPSEDIAQWCSMLNEGGELFLQTGDSADLEQKHHHRPYSLPDHLSFTSRRLLIELLEKIGMEVIQVEGYRMGQFPRFTPVELVKECIRFFHPGHTATFHFFPTHPNRDMYIRARKPHK